MSGVEALYHVVAARLRLSVWLAFIRARLGPARAPARPVLRVAERVADWERPTVDARPAPRWLDRNRDRRWFD